MKKIWIAGGGGHGGSVLDSALALNEYDEIAVTDPFIKPGTIIMGDIRNIGCDEDVIPVISKWNDEGSDYGVHIAVGGIKDLQKREAVAGSIQKICASFFSVIDASAVISPYARISCGVFVGKQAAINAGAYVGKHAIINTGAIIEHDCHIGDFSHVSVGARVCGGARIGDFVFIGAGAVVIQGITIGSHSIVGAGSVVLRNIETGEKVVGIVKKED